MKIHLHVDETVKQIEIHIYTPEYNSKVEKMLQQLKHPTSETIIGYVHQDIHVIKLEDVYAVHSEGAKVYLQTEELEYIAKHKLYEIEEQYTKTFVRINKSTLINLHKLQSIQNKLGMTYCLLNNEISFPISRSYLKQLKTKLGIGGK